MKKSSDMSDLDKQIAHLNQFVKFAEMMIKRPSSLDQTFEIRGAIFDAQIQIGMRVQEKVRILKNEKLVGSIPSLGDELRDLNVQINKLEEEVEKWIIRRADDEIDQSDEMGRELEEMLSRLGLLSDDRDGLSLELEFSNTDTLSSLR